jgi:hypothetical protein
MTSAAPPAAPHQLCSLRLGYMPVGLLLSSSYRPDRQQARQLPGCHGCLLEHLLNCVPHASVEHLTVIQYNDSMSIKPFCHTELTDSHLHMPTSCNSHHPIGVRCVTGLWHQASALPVTLSQRPKLQV